LLWIPLNAQEPPSSGSTAQAEAPILDEDVNVWQFAEMPYPLAANLSNVQGVVVVRAQVDDLGRVRSAIALSGAAKLFPDAVANIKKWEFQPNGLKTVVVVYDFRLEGLCNGITSHFVFRRPNVASVRSCGVMVQGY
jgi:TonB family protein